jgi:hypothetical protein
MAPPQLAHFSHHRPSVSVVPFAVHPNHHKSWFSPNLKAAAKGAARILFISDAAADTVTMLTLPDLTMIGQITGFTSPYGMCPDGTGGVWVTDADTGNLYHESRSGQQISVLADPGAAPYGCAYDKTTGNLAVMNDEGAVNNAGSVDVFANASGTPTSYVSKIPMYYFWGDYDTNGNLFVDAQTVSLPNTFELLELPSGSSLLQILSLSGGRVTFPGMVQWSAVHNYLALGDQECGGSIGRTCVNQVKLTSGNARITGRTVLKNHDGSDACDVLQGTIGANNESYIVGANYDFCKGYKYPFAYRWNWPRGDKPTNYDPSFSFGGPIGTAISTK